MLALPFSNFVNALQGCFYFLVRYYQLKVDEKMPERKVLKLGLRVEFKHI